ncbi:hypothetical protein PFLU4_42560 [Pseudomonas fluorescens]|nr:hypothetical protein PFLU4_42560 [Pseudomonas fluorescens]RDI06292.1 hypothetical protein DFO59_103455 [Pseudomonas fluorescens]UII17033.1 hypothetical protein LRP86_03950 [Pseudomonas brassicacearum]
MPGFQEVELQTLLWRHAVGARLARDEDDAVYLEPRRLHREQALLPQLARINRCRPFLNQPNAAMASTDSRINAGPL